MKTSLHAILKIKEQPRSLISDAEKQADAIRAVAQARSDEIVRQAKSDAKIESDALVKKFQTEIEDIIVILEGKHLDSPRIGSFRNWSWKFGFRFLSAPSACSAVRSVRHPHDYAQISL